MANYTLCCELNQISKRPDSGVLKGMGWGWARSFLVEIISLFNLTHGRKCPFGNLPPPLPTLTLLQLPCTITITVCGPMIFWLFDCLFFFYELFIYLFIFIFLGRRSSCYQEIENVSKAKICRVLVFFFEVSKLILNKNKSVQIKISRFSCLHIVV